MKHSESRRLCDGN